ncbi:MAG: hypothetical protein HY903_19980 [Deltaproteobacteria bacterium]|nr:hypothetical protein [Deltaproteobacteria bacterium]
MRRQLIACGLVLLSCLISCRGCREEPGPGSVLDLAAPDARMVAYVPDTGQLVGGVGQFLTRATKTGGKEAVRRFRESLKGQVGLDPLDLQAYQGSGLSAKDGALIFEEAGGSEPLFAIGVANREAFETKLEEIIEKVDGANRYREATVAGVKVRTAGRPFGDELVPAFHWCFVGRFAILARDAGHASLTHALERWQGFARQQPPPSLRADPVYLQLARKVPAAPLSIFVRGQVADALAAAKAPLSGAMTAVTLDGAGVQSDTFLGLSVPGLDAALKAAPVAGLLSRVDPEAVVVLLSASAKADFIALLQRQPFFAELISRGLKPLAEATGIDPEREVLPGLAGPLSVALSLGSLRELPQRLKARRDLAAFVDLIQVAVIADLADPKAFSALLGRSQHTLQERGVRIRTRVADVGGTKATVFEPDVKEPKLGWTVVGGRYVYAAGTGRLDATLKLLAAGKSALEGRLASSVAKAFVDESGASVLLLRLGGIADAAMTMPVGGGKVSGMGVEAVFGALVEILRTLGDVAFAVSAEPDGLRLRVSERLQ